MAVRLAVVVVVVVVVVDCAGAARGTWPRGELGAKEVTQQPAGSCSGCRALHLARTATQQG